MNNKQYIMIGAPTITKEIFRNILRPLNNYGFKPNGGFWASELISYRYTISDWFTYLQYEGTSIARHKNLNESNIFTLKEDAKILIINTVEKVLELAEQYPSYHHILGYFKNISERNTIFDYEKLSQKYDGIYIDFNYFQNQFRTDVFDSFGSNSLLLFNLDCIQSYQTAPIIFDIDNPYSLPYIDDDKISTSIYIEKETWEHQKLTDISQEIFNNLMYKHTISNFKDYDEFLSKVIENIVTTINHLTKEKDKITTIRKILKEQKMIVSEELIVRNIVLNYLSKYLTQNQIKIEQLPQTKIKQLKNYNL